MKLSSRLLLLFSLISIASVGVMGQAAPPTVSTTPTTTTEPRTKIDETFELNIDERRITETNFEASTSIGTDGDSGLNLQIGVGLTAGGIDVLLRNVRGSVRFRGTLHRIIEVLSNRPATPAKPAPQ